MMDEMNEGALDNVVKLTDQDGNEVAFELLDVVEHEGENYIILLPADDDSNEVVILQQTGEDEENEEYAAVVDDEVAGAVFELFRQRNPELCE